MDDISRDSNTSAHPLRDAADALRTFALGLPGAYEEFPWGERVVKVNKKIFVFFGVESDLDTKFGLGVKLPVSAVDVLSLPFAEPSGYGLGKSGWVTLRFLPDDQLPLDMLQRWILESYRAIAPKKLVARLTASATV
jgi:predicted DNA-binding protein (MmcQ/YjbR family)